MWGGVGTNEGNKDVEKLEEILGKNREEIKKTNRVGDSFQHMRIRSKIKATRIRKDEPKSGDEQKSRHENIVPDRTSVSIAEAFENTCP